MIHTSLAPNLLWSDVRIALSYVFLPWKWLYWKSGTSVGTLETQFKNMHSAAYAKSFSSGREALYATLRSFDIGKGDEVILQAYTCIVVPNAILWSGAQPVYVDIDESLNIDVAKLESAITPKTKAVIVQHTFGTPAQIDKIIDIAKKHNIKVIEDCAHSLGATFHNQLVGTFGDAAIFSFGRDKIISSVQGGMAIFKKKPEQDFLKKLDGIKSLSTWTIFQDLMHIIKFPGIKATYTFGIGKISLYILQKIGILNRVYKPKEKRGEELPVLMHKYPNALAKIALNQMKHLQEFQKHRHGIAKIYSQMLKVDSQKTHTGSNVLRYTIFIKDPKKVLLGAKKKNMLLGNWYQSVIVPEPTDYKKYGYTKSSCTVAEKKASQSLNLPTHKDITKNDALAVIEFLKKHI